MGALYQQLDLLREGQLMIADFLSMAQLVAGGFQACWNCGTMMPLR